MEKYNYLETMIKAVLAYIRDELLDKEESKLDFSSREALEGSMMDDDWLRWDVVDLTLSEWEVEEYLRGNMELIMEAADDYGVSMNNVFMRGVCYADSLIRHYLLHDAMEGALDILETNDEISYGVAV